MSFNDFLKEKLEKETVISNVKNWFNERSNLDTFEELVNSIPEKYKNDDDILFLCMTLKHEHISEDENRFKYFDESVWNKELIIKILHSVFGRTLFYMPEKFKNDPEIASIAAITWPKIYFDISDKLKNNEEFVNSILTGIELWNNKDYIIFARNNIEKVYYRSTNDDEFIAILKDIKPDIIAKFIDNFDPKKFNLLSMEYTEYDCCLTKQYCECQPVPVFIFGVIEKCELFKNKEIMDAVIRKDAEFALKYYMKDIVIDKNNVSFFTNMSKAFYCTPDELKTKEMVLSCIDVFLQKPGDEGVIDTLDLYAFPDGVVKSAIDELYNNDKQKFNALLKICSPPILRYLPSKNDDKEFVLELFKYNQKNLEFVSDNLKDDKEVVEASVSTCQSAYLFEFASDNLKDDKDFVLHLIDKTRFCYLKYISDRLKNDKDIILATVKTNPDDITRIPDKFKKDKDVILAAYNCSSNGYDIFNYVNKETVYSNDFIEEIRKINPADAQKLEDKIKEYEDKIKEYKEEYEKLVSEGKISE